MRGIIHNIITMIPPIIPVMEPEATVEITKGATVSIPFLSYVSSAGGKYNLGSSSIRASIVGICLAPEATSALT